MRQLIAGIVILATLDLAYAQTAPEQASTPSFEVTSVKPNKSGDGRVISSTLPNRYVSINITPRMLILAAYQLQGAQLTGGPTWLASERFDVEAKSDRTFSTQELFPMLQTLLATEFKLTFHHEARDIPAYSLVMTEAKTEKSRHLQPGLAATCALTGETRRSPQNPSGLLGCGGTLVYPGHLTGRSVPMVRVANYLAGQVKRVVVDRRGLEGVFDLELDYTPDQIPSGALPNGIVGDASSPSLFTALQEQLGLKLESERGPVPVMVIDQIERPTDD